MSCPKCKSEKIEADADWNVRCTKCGYLLLKADSGLRYIPIYTLNTMYPEI